MLPTPDDDPQPQPAPAPMPALPNRQVTCEFCGCRLAPEDGAVLARGDAAKRYLRLSDDIDTLTAENGRLTAELTEAKRQIKDLTARDSSDRRRGILGIGRRE